MKLAKVPLRLKEPCPTVVDLPDGPMGAETVGRAWAKDRLSLGDCRAKHMALVGAVEAIEAQGR